MTQPGSRHSTVICSRASKPKVRCSSPTLSRPMASGSVGVWRGDGTLRWGANRSPLPVLAPCTDNSSTTARIGTRIPIRWIYRQQFAMRRGRTIADEIGVGSEEGPANILVALTLVPRARQQFGPDAQRHHRLSLSLGEARSAVSIWNGHPRWPVPGVTRAARGEVHAGCS